MANYLEEESIDPFPEREYPAIKQVKSEAPQHLKAKHPNSQHPSSTIHN